jgi:hypothetical protein
MKPKSLTLVMNNSVFDPGASTERIKSSLEEGITGSFGRARPSIANASWFNTMGFVYGLRGENNMPLAHFNSATVSPCGVADKRLCSRRISWSLQS